MEGESQPTVFHEINEHLVVLRIIHERNLYITALIAAHQLGRSVEDVLMEAGKLQITSNSMPLREWKTPEPPPAKA
jgi:hypothetical protein